ncbi:HlyD family efflux transporter periplasmic adaptor subunit [Salmonella enterica subsp. enterica serovar Stanley]|nr:HlyD family efflux transporter periplasmic adaptor subunit [Salmonella enterica subsp. enterica serovar Stanley]
MQDDSNASIFRQEALRHKKETWLGTSAIKPPNIAKVTVIASFSTLLATIIVLNLNYTQRVTVKGSIIYSPPASEVLSKGNGIINKVFHKEGENVRKGEHIFSVQVDTAILNGDKNQSIKDLLHHRRDELVRNLDLEQRGYIEKYKNLQMKKEIKEKEKKAQEVLIVKQEKLVQSLKKRFDYFEMLRRKGLTLTTDSIDRENEYNLADKDLGDMQLNVLSLDNDISDINSKIIELKQNHDKNISDISLSLNETEQKIVDAESGTEFFGVSPISGRLASISVIEGRKINNADVGAVIIPNNSTPYVELFVPSEIISDISIGAKVKIRVSSLPYQWYGKIPGVVDSISITPISLSGSNTKFRIMVKINEKNNKYIMPAGVSVETDIMTKTRKIWQWIFLPLETVTKRLIGNEDA